MTRMHRTSRPLAVLAVLLATCATGLVMAATTGMVDLRSMQPVHGDAAAGKAASTVCAACHGADGNAIVPQFPDLAGQSATYLYVQLRAYKDGWRENAVMQGQAAALDDQDMRDLAAYYASLVPAAAQSPGTGSRGATLFHEGDPTLGVPACQGCHGRDGRGPRHDPASTAPQPAWSTFPAVAGQSADYVAQQLKAYRDGSRSGSSNTEVMHGVVQHLDTQDMQALGDYISTM